MKRLLYILPILAMIIAGCSREPYADGIVTPNPAYVGEDVTFKNLSTHSDYVEWDFGDGFSSDDFNTTHYYVDPGNYNARLKAFGTKGGVNTWSFTMELIGSELTVVVQLWTPPEEPEGYYVPGASVIIYPTYEDWLKETNGSEEGFTNQYGEVTFTGLSYQRYYVDVWEANHDNYTLAGEDVGWIETPMLDGTVLWTFIAYVDYYPDGKKSTARTHDKALMMEQGASGEKRELKENTFSVPRK
jgi:PKD repeat protein